MLVNSKSSYKQENAMKVSTLTLVLVLNEYVLLPIQTDRFPAKLRWLHQCVTGGLHYIILNYEARLCYCKDTISLNSQADQWNMGTHYYSQLDTRFSKITQFHKLPFCIRLSFCLWTQCKPPLSQLPLSFPTVFVDVQAAYYKNTCQFYVTR